MKLATFRRTAYPNIFNKALGEDLATITIVIIEKIIGIRIKERQTSPNRRVMKPIM